MQRTPMSWVVGAVMGLAVVVTSASCGQATLGQGGGGSGTPGGSGRVAGPADFTARARAVAAAWTATAASAQWREGLVPLQDLTIAPTAGFPDSDTKQAFLNGSYVLRTTLPDAATRATVTFADGSTKAVTAVGARTAYSVLRQMDPQCPSGGSGRSTIRPTPPPADAGPDGVTASEPQLMCGRLTVTSATLVTTTIRTSRGQARVPAWRFGVKELAQPVLRVALDDTAVTPLPEVSPDGPAPAAGLAGAQTWDSVRGRALGFTVGVGDCDKDVVGRVFETARVVVVGGTVRPPGPDVVCTAMLRLAPVTVDLAKPLGERVVLDVASGRPLILGGR